MAALFQKTRPALLTHHYKERMIDGSESPNASELSTKLVVLHVVKDCTPVSLNHALVRVNKEFKHARF